MAKRKVVIEGNVEYLIRQQGIFQGRLQVMQKFPISVEIKSTKNSGGEAWDWAQSHWPDFIPEEGPGVLVLMDVEGNTCEPDELETELRWFCVTGVTDVRGKDLPVEKTEWRNTHRTPKGIKNSKNKKTKGQKSYPADNSSGLKARIAKPKKQPKAASSDSLDIDSIKAENIKKAMAKDVN